MKPTELKKKKKKGSVGFVLNEFTSLLCKKYYDFMLCLNYPYSFNGYPKSLIKHL